MDYTCSNCAIYGQIIKRSDENFKYRGHTILELTWVKNFQFSAFNEVLIYLFY